MKVRNKLKLSELLTKQSNQIDRVVKKFEKNITSIMKDATTDKKLKFYSDMNNVYKDKLNTLQEVISF